QRLLPQLKKFNVLTDSSEFTDTVKLSLAAKAADFAAFCVALQEIGAGRIAATELGTRFGV
ncbi:MAG: DUF1949 domain-containing protein, partial [Clostridia bacterium]|nr:DUF1949 domain-containing protein [Clostridia bacterium]